MKSRSLATRLTLWYGATAFLLLGSVALVQYRTLDQDLAGEDDQLLLETVAAAKTRATPLPEIGAAHALLGPRVRLVDANCRVILGQPKTKGPPTVCDPPWRDSPEFRTWISPGGRVWRSLAQRLRGDEPILIGSIGRPVWIEATLDRWTDMAILAGYRRKLSILLPVALFLSALLGFGIARHELSPLTTLALSLSKVDAASLHEKIALQNGSQAPREVVLLIDSLETMRLRLNEQFALLTEFSAELAHEFRTPVHILKQQAELALSKNPTAQEFREVLSSSLEELERLHRMVDDTLFLARAADPRSAVNKSVVDINEELEHVAGFLDALAIDKGVSVTHQATEPMFVLADRMLLRRALVNVVHNAISHTPANGEVSLSVIRTGEAVVIRTTDTGAGIPSASLPHVFERYFRVSGSEADREGAGLGLAIVRGIMTLHGGKATIKSALGQGTTVSLEFPVSRERWTAAPILTKM
ncbi:MAG: ATP-binding protein [Gemmatimonadota bacterium]|nr:ATP-binding protein [Gemmatimonadota bacterium]